MIKKILIANRGEIAVRVARTCNSMNIKTVGIYSQEDRNSMHLDFCDEKFLLGDDPLRESYLNPKKIIEICKITKASALHPGYGFLSENSNFVKMLEKNNIIFIGPPSSAIKKMGDKIESKTIARKAGVNCIPGVEKSISNLEKALFYARKIGFPVMVKASAGGGGKGMRIVYKEENMQDSLKSAKNEALNSFGDNRVFLEKYIERPRHIEIQILADKKGNFLSLGERECSIQRRHQKIIEEAPSPFLDDSTRKKMGDQAIKLAKAVNYYSAGTVEFIVNEKKEFFFLEMNTRLQVEHPVTEQITGIDIVKEMIKIAEGKTLKIKQKSLKPKGWAIESRICAENPKNNFLPSAGRITEFKIPSKNIRIDTGFSEGKEVSVYYDSLLAKIIAFAATRKDAIRIMVDTLQKTYIKGISSNLSFLLDIYEKQEFKEGKIDTNFISKFYKDGYVGKPKSNTEIEIGAIATICLELDNQYRVSKNKISFYKNWNIKSIYKELEIEVISFSENSISMKLNNLICNASYEIIYPGFFMKVHINNNSYLTKFYSASNPYKFNIKGYYDEIYLRPTKIIRYLKKLPHKKSKTKNHIIKSPMPAKVVEILVKKGDRVEIGDKLLILDAMKMENLVCSDFSGVVRDILVKKNDSVIVNQDLIII